jgi:hypothetical protein
MPNVHTRLFMAEGDHRIDLGSAAGGNVAGGQRYDEQESHHGDEGDGIKWLNAEQEAVEVFCEADGGADTKNRADKHKGQALLNNHANDVALLRAKSDANANLPGTARDFVGKEAIEADACE